MRLYGGSDNIAILRAEFLSDKVTLEEALPSALAVTETWQRFDRLLLRLLIRYKILHT